MTLWKEPWPFYRWKNGFQRSSVSHHWHDRDLSCNFLHSQFWLLLHIAITIMIVLNRFGSWNKNTVFFFILFYKKLHNMIITSMGYGTKLGYLISYPDTPWTKLPKFSVHQFPYLQNQQHCDFICTGLLWVWNENYSVIHRNH